MKKNKYFILRHGEAYSNKKEIISCWPEKIYNPLTPKGRKQIESAAQKLKKKKIDLIFSSDIFRTRQTAEIVARELKLKPIFDKRLREYNMGTFNGKPIKEVRKIFPVGAKRFKVRPPQGETYSEIKDRMLDFLRETDKKYTGKNILIVSHEIPLTILEGTNKGFSDKEILKKYSKEKRIKTGEIRSLVF